MTVGCVGRGGRLPCVIYNTAMVDGLSLNGIAPVNTCIDTKCQLPIAIRAVDHPQRTSIMTMAKEKMSASLLNVPSVKTSGAAHRGV